MYVKIKSSFYIKIIQVKTNLQIKIELYSFFYVKKTRKDINH